MQTRVGPVIVLDPAHGGTDPGARGAMADVVSGGPKPKVAHRFYHVPASNTAVGHLILENAA